jgi:hypothetical protein
MQQIKLLYYNFVAFSPLEKPGDMGSPRHGLRRGNPVYDTAGKNPAGDFIQRSPQ